MGRFFIAPSVYQYEYWVGSLCNFFNSNPDGCKISKQPCCWESCMTPQATNRREGGLTSCCGHSRNRKHLHRERARVREVGSETAWCANYCRGECLARGWWQKELKEANKPPASRNTQKWCQKWAVSLTFYLKNQPKPPFFAQKYLIRHITKMFFEEYINFKIFHYLRYCGVIPVRSFGIHVCPQPSGLGLKFDYCTFTAR